MKIARVFPGGKTIPTIDAVLTAEGLTAERQAAIAAVRTYADNTYHFLIAEIEAFHSKSGWKGGALMWGCSRLTYTEVPGWDRDQYEQAIYAAKGLHALMDAIGVYEDRGQHPTADHDFEFTLKAISDRLTSLDDTTLYDRLVRTPAYEGRFRIAQQVAEDLRVQSGSSLPVRADDQRVKVNVDDIIRGSLRIEQRAAAPAPACQV